MDLKDIKSLSKNTKNSGKRELNDFYTKLEQAKEHKRLYHKKWNVFLKFYKGEQWSKNRPSYRVSSVENMIFSQIEATIPIIVQNNPEIVAQPQTPDDIELAEQLNQVFKFIWHKIQMEEKIIYVVRDMLLFGIGILKTYWNSEMYNGMGEVGCDQVDPFDFFISPGATDITNCEYIIYRTRRSVQDLQAEYPNFAKKIVSDFDYINDDTTRDTLEKRKSIKNDDMATVYEYWHKRIGEDGKRYVHVSVITGDNVLESKPSPFEYDGYPFTIFHCYKLHNEFFSMGMAENLIELQKETNALRSIVVENALHNTNTVWVMTTNSGLQKKDITNRAGQVFNIHPSAKIDRLAPPPIPSYVQGMIAENRRAIEGVSGVFEITQGYVSSSSIASAAALDILTSNARSRIELKVKFLEQGIKRLAEQWIAILRQNYMEERYIRLTGKDKVFKFETFDASLLRQQQPQTELVQDPITGEMVEQPVLDENGEPLMVELLTEFDITVNSGAGFMLNKAAKFERNLSLFKSGALDLETLLESGDFNAQKVISNLIRYGVIPDPNAPKSDFKQFLIGMGDKMRFNINSQDPQVVADTLDYMMAQKQQMDEEQLMRQNQLEQESGFDPIQQHNPEQLQNLPPEPPAF